MTKELYPRPRAKIGEIVVYKSSYPDGSCKYFQAVIDLADCVDQWRYSTECSANDFYDGDIVENLTTGAKEYRKAFDETFNNQQLCEHLYGTSVEVGYKGVNRVLKVCAKCGLSTYDE